MLPVYGRKCLSRKAVRNCVEKFSQERSKVADDARPSRPVEIATEAAVQRVEELIRADRRIRTDSVATAPGCSHGLAYRRIRTDSVATAPGCAHGLAYSIMHDCLKFRKVCARWVPRKLKDREMGLSLQRLLRYADE
jgi:hypothetical protein